MPDSASLLTLIESTKFTVQAWSTGGLRRLVVCDAKLRDTCSKVGRFGAFLLILLLPESPLLAVETQANDRGSRLFSALPTGRWVKVQQQKPKDRVHFKQQAHAGSAFDTRRGKFIVFGSDTHGIDWTNSPLVFDTMRLEWSRLYPDDLLSTYRINEIGIPVAGKHANHPWAMHTFGAVVYDPVADQIIIASLPSHMEPGRFTNTVAHLWPRIQRHPTWVLSLATGKWTALPGRAIHFFPYAATYDLDRKVVVGYRDSGIYELGGKPRTWKRVSKRGLLRYHNNVVYDQSNKALVAFGSVGGSNDIAVYRPRTGRHVKMKTPGLRPPKDEHAPMAFHERLGRTVVLIDREFENASGDNTSTWQAETWLYDLTRDQWRQVTSATLPFRLKMNYNMAYDPIHAVMLLVATPPGETTAVWALRL